MSFFETASKALSFAMITTGLASCAEPLEKSDSPIIGGQTTTGDPAVMMLIAYPPDHSVLDACTATLISPTVLLTAAHCVDSANHPGYSYGVFPGPDASAYPTLNSIIPHLLSIQSVHAHPNYNPDAPFEADIAVAILAGPSTVDPLPILRVAPTNAMVGQPARIVGYGQAVYGQSSSTKRSADTVLASIDGDDTVSVGDTVKHSCVGDSGGPALMMVLGVETVIGADSYTDEVGCQAPAHYRRTDLYLPFIDQYATAPTSTVSSSSASTGTGASASVGSGEGGASTSSNGATDGAASTSGAGGSNGLGGGLTGDDQSGGCSVGHESRSSFGALALALGLTVMARRRALRRAET